MNGQAIELRTTEPACLPAQPFLFSEQTIEGLTKAEKQGRYTLERLREFRPEAIDEIIHLRGEFVGKLRIAEIVHVAHETVTAVDAAYPEAISIARESRVARLRSAGDKLVEQIDQNPGLVPWHAKAVAASQLYDRAELLNGGVTERVEHVGRVDIYSDWPAFVAKQLQPDQVLEVGSRMGLDGGNLSPIEDESVQESGELEAAACADGKADQD
jgi:hypothetical protein